MFERMGAQAACIKRSRGGLSTKIHASVDGAGNPLRFVLSPGQESDIRHAGNRVTRFKSFVVIGDKGYDSESFVSSLKNQQTNAIIPSRKTNKKQRYYNREPYKDRNCVERFFARLKQLHRVATRYEKKTVNYLSIIDVACIRLFIK